MINSKPSPADRPIKRLSQKRTLHNEWTFLSAVLMVVIFIAQYFLQRFAEVNPIVDVILSVLVALLMMAILIQTFRIKEPVSRWLLGQIQHIEKANPGTIHPLVLEEIADRLRKGTPTTLLDAVIMEKHYLGPDLSDGERDFLAKFARRTPDGERTKQQD